MGGAARTTATPASAQVRTSFGDRYGEEDPRIHKAAGEGRFGHAFAADWPRRWDSAASTSWGSVKNSTLGRKTWRRARRFPPSITVYQDKSFTFVTKTPPATFFLKQAMNLKSGAKNTGREVVGQITREQLREIAQKKMKDLNANDIEAASRIIEGSARAMGLRVVEA